MKWNDLSTECCECWHADRRHGAVTEPGRFSLWVKLSFLYPLDKFKFSHYEFYSVHAMTFPDRFCGNPRDPRHRGSWSHSQPPRPRPGTDVSTRLLPLPPKVRKSEDDFFLCPSVEISQWMEMQVPVRDRRHIPWQSADGGSSFARHGSQPGGDHRSPQVETKHCYPYFLISDNMPADIISFEN